MVRMNLSKAKLDCAHNAKNKGQGFIRLYTDRLLKNRKTVL